MWRREEREEREIAKKEEDKEIEFIMKSTGRVCVQRISFLLISNWRGFRSHSLNLTLYINIYFSFNYCYTYIPTLPCTTFPFYPLISCQWSGNPILGFPYSTPILPQRLLVLRLTNKSIKRFGNSGFEKHDLKMGIPSIVQLDYGLPLHCGGWISTLLQPYLDLQSNAQLLTEHITFLRGKVEFSLMIHWTTLGFLLFVFKTF